VRKWNSSEPIIRTVSALDAVLANNGDDAGRRLLNFVMKATEHDEYYILFSYSVFFLLN